MSQFKFFSLITSFKKLILDITVTYFSAFLLSTGAFVATLPALHAQTAGAPMPFVDFNAATSPGVQTNGKVLGPGLYFGQLAMEAEGRKAVILVGQGQYVSFTLAAPANGVTIHYAIPDAPGGNGITQPLSLYTNNTFVTSLSLTSAYSWLYGPYSAVLMRYQGALSPESIWSVDRVRGLCNGRRHYS